MAHWLIAFERVRAPTASVSGIERAAPGLDPQRVVDRGHGLGEDLWIDDPVPVKNGTIAALERPGHGLSARPRGQA